MPWATGTNLSPSEVARITGQFKVPVTDFHPDYWYIASILRDSARPTDEELRLIRRYIEFVATDFYGQDAARRIMAAELPVESGHNTVIFAKRGTNKWSYRRSTWEVGPAFYPPMGENLTLAQVIDHVVGDSQAPRWHAFAAKAA